LDLSYYMADQIFERNFYHFWDLFSYTMFIGMLFNPCVKLLISSTRCNWEWLRRTACLHYWHPRPDSGYGYNRSAHFPWKPEVQRRTFQLYSWRSDQRYWFANAGETVAIVGSTGAGKSTIINLLNRFYEIDSGEICIDNQNIERYTLESLRNQIAVVLQDVFLCRHGFQ
jgi:hypothetical protein